MKLSDHEFNDISALKTAQLFISKGWENYGVPSTYVASTFEILERMESKRKQQDFFKKLTDLDNAESAFTQARKKYHSLQPKKQILMDLFKKWLLPGNVLEIGCGSGFLAKPLIKNGFTNYVGTDLILPAKETNEDPKISFIKQKVSSNIPVKEDSFNNAIIIDMFHHVESDEQESLLRKISMKLKESGRIVFFEYSFSQTTNYQERSYLDKEFLKLSKSQKCEVMAIVDYIGNILVGQSSMLTPFSFRTLEEWQEVFNKTGLRLIENRYLGILSDLFHPGPYSFLVAEKV